MNIFLEKYQFGIVRLHKTSELTAGAGKRGLKRRALLHKLVSQAHAKGTSVQLMGPLLPKSLAAGVKVKRGTAQEALCLAGYLRASTATDSTCLVWGNMSTGVTLRSV